MSISPVTRSALIIGGGIAGPVTAAALRKAGIHAHVIEAYPDAAGGLGGAIALAPNGLAALDVIGAGDAVRAHGVPIATTRMTIDDHEVARLPTLDRVEPLRMVRRGALRQTLHDCALSTGAQYSYGRRLVRIEEATAAVTAVFDDGSTETADIVIGADGVRSTVRHIIDPNAPAPRYTGLLAFESEAHLDLGPFDGMTFAFGRNAYYLYWPEPGNRVVWGANLPSKQYLSLTDARRTAPETWLQRLEAVYGPDHPGAEFIAATTPTTLQISGGIHLMPSIPRWHRDRMVLVGDAVHAPSNSTGQGASLAIESGIELARALRDSPDHASAFAAYEQLRRPRVESITRRGARTNQTKTPGPVLRRIMRAVMPIAIRHLNFERTLGPEQRYRIDWEQTLLPS